MKFYMLGIMLFFGSTITLSGRVVTFNRVTVASGLNVPHGDWAGNIDGTSPKYELDIFATIAVAKQAVWYRNTNKGATWSASNLIWTSPYYNQEIAGIDLNNNTTIDAVSTDDQTSATGTSYLLLHTNSGGGSFTTANINSAAISGLFRQMRLADMEGDGDIDIIVAVNTNRFYTLQTAVGAYWFENNGSAVFTQHLIGFCNAWKIDCFDNDVPKDGHLDIVVSECYHGDLDTMANCKLIMYKNNGAEGFSPYVIDNTLGPPYRTQSGGAGVRCVDLNNNGLVDIVSGNASTGVFYRYMNNGSNSFTKYTVDNNCPNIDGIDIGDFEPDGDMDVVVAGRNYWFRWYENDGNGNLTSHTIDTQYQLFDLPYVSYFDGDSCPDIVLTESSSNGYVFAYLNPCPGGNVEETSYENNIWLKVPSVMNASGGYVKLSFKTANTGRIVLEARDVTGNLVDVIAEKALSDPGTYQAIWDVKNKPNGVYFLNLKADNSSIKKKIIILR